jgi:hypothetical protein
MASERRRHERIRIRAEVHLVQDGREAHFVARDVSLGGAFVSGGGHAVGVDLAAGRRVKITLLPHEDAPYHAEDGDGAAFRARARVVRSDATGVGLSFEEIDVENLARLRALVEESD